MAAAQGKRLLEMTSNIIVVVADSDEDKVVETKHQVQKKPSQLEELLTRLQKAAVAGNQVLVEDRCQQIRELCSFSAFKESRSRSACASIASDSGRRCGGLQYRPEYLLQTVLLADKLRLD